MNLKVELDKNICLTQTVVALLIKIIGEDIKVYKNIVDSSNININIDKLENNMNYKILVSVVMEGKQILRKFKEFTYENYDEYTIDENIKIRDKINDIMIKKVSLINDGDKTNLNIAVNPLVVLNLILVKMISSISKFTASFNEIKSVCFVRAFIFKLKENIMKNDIIKNNKFFNNFFFIYTPIIKILT